MANFESSRAYDALLNAAGAAASRGDMDRWHELTEKAAALKAQKVEEISVPVYDETH